MGGGECPAGNPRGNAPCHPQPPPLLRGIPHPLPAALLRVLPSPSPPPTRRCGAAVAAGWAARGHAVSVVVTGGSTSPPRSTLGGLRAEASGISADPTALWGKGGAEGALWPHMCPQSVPRAESHRAPPSTKLSRPRNAAKPEPKASLGGLPPPSAPIGEQRGVGGGGCRSCHYQLHSGGFGVMQTHTAAVGVQPGSGCGGGSALRPLHDAHQHCPPRGTAWAQPGRSQAGAAPEGGVGGVRGLRREQLSAVGGARDCVPAAGDGWAKGLGALRGWTASAPRGGNRRHPTGGGKSGGGTWREGGASALRWDCSAALCAAPRRPHPASRIPHPDPTPPGRQSAAHPTDSAGGRKGRGGMNGGGLCPSRAGAPGGSGTEELFVPAALRLFIRAADISGRPRARAPRPRCGCDPQVPPPPSIPPIRLCPTHTQWGL